MTSSKDFKQAIRAGNINEAFLIAMSNVPELSITTKIISSEGEVKAVDSNKSQADNYLRTQIDLINGKIENEIGEKLTGDRYSEIKQFHLRQVTQGHQTIQHNLISLQKMFQLMSAFQQQQAAENLNWVDIAADVSRDSLPIQPKTDRLYGKTPDALAAGKPDAEAKTINSDLEQNRAKPELPSFEENEENVVDDLLSLADLDDDSPEEQPSAESEDWGEWLEDEPEVKSEVFNLKSLNIRKTQNWQNWDTSTERDSQEE